MDDKPTDIQYFEELGETEVSRRMSSWPQALQGAAIRWLALKRQESERLNEASQAAQAEAASRANVAAERAAIAAERQARAAESANTRATIALIIAIVSMIATIIGIWIVHLDTMRSH